MRSHRWYFLLSLLAAGVMGPLQAQAAVILSTTSYSESFDEPKLSDTSVTPRWNGLTQAAVPGTSGWDGVRVGGTGTAGMNYSVNDGASNSGAIYSYGATASTERALGSVASGTNIGAVGVELNNQIGAAITQVTISYTGEFWRSSTTTQNVLTFGYSIGASGSATYLSDAATSVAALNLVGPASVAANGALNGNVAPNRAAFMATFDVAVPSGQSLYLRWQDTNDGGNDAGLAIDNFQLTATAVSVPEPSALVACALGLIGLSISGLRRRLCI